MFERVLAAFPAHTHPLFLVSDPDAVLADESLLTTLSARGFTLLRETDPIALRHRVEAARPWTLERPLIVATSGALNALPYDLWQQGRHVTLALNTFFPHLAYPVVRSLSPARRARLAAAPPPPQRLAERATQHHILQHAFAADPAALEQPAQLLAWLATYHQERDPLPEPLLATLLAALQTLPAYAGWPLAALFCDPDAFAAFVREQWAAYVQAAQRGQVQEAPGGYLCFGADAALQDALPRLVRTGALAPVQVARLEQLPEWAHPALLAAETDRAARRMAELLALVQEQLPDLSPAARWAAWERIAWDWAELTALRYQPDAAPEAALTQQYQQTQDALDAAFAAWLPAHYAPLATQSLPLPHHLYHVPHYLAYRYLEQQQRVALLVLDGMALADWVALRAAWQTLHPTWRFEERLVLAQLPTITSVSRQALLSGLRPTDFAASLGTTQQEPRHWQQVGARYGLDKAATHLSHLRLAQSNAAEVAPAYSPTRTWWACFIETSLDDLVHNATLGQSDFAASFSVWLTELAPRLATFIEGLLAQGFSIALTSDHGHTEALGMGAPNEGLVVETRSQRCRFYTDPLAAERAQQAFPQTLLWRADGLLPTGLHVLIPQARLAFAPARAKVITHGGAMLDEVLVPLALISQQG